MILAFFNLFFLLFSSQGESLCDLCQIVIKLRSSFDDKSIKDTYVNQKAKRLFFHKKYRNVREEVFQGFVCLGKVRLFPFLNISGLYTIKQ